MKACFLFQACLFAVSTEAFLPTYRAFQVQTRAPSPINPQHVQSQNDLNFAKKASSHSTTVVMASPSEDFVSEFPSPSNTIFGFVWITLIAFTTFFAPGTFGAVSDNEMLAAIVQNPLHPDINQLFYFVFNLFVIIPVCLAAIILPQASDEGVPPSPFLIGSAFLGYFALGPYLAFKEQANDVVDFNRLNWITQNVFENKVFNWFQVALFVYFAVTYAIEPALADTTGLLQGFQELVSSSKFAAVSTADLSLLSITAATLIPQDYKLRNPQDASRGVLIGLGTLLLPVLGSALYCALRPQLPK